MIAINDTKIAKKYHVEWAVACHTCREKGALGQFPTQKEAEGVAQKHDKTNPKHDITVSPGITEFHKDWLTD